MRVFLAGASGAIGRPLTRMLVAAGHEVTGTTRREERASIIEAAGARPVIVEIHDGAALVEAMAASCPEIVIHQVTDLAAPSPERLTDEQLRRNAAIREAGTRHLVEAAAALGARRVIAQSIAWLYLPGPEPHTEDESIVPADAGQMTPTRRGVLELERLVTTDDRFEGVVLRYGRLYGPGTWCTIPAEPPTVHVDAAAEAALLAVDHGHPGIYFIADDGGPVSNARARLELGWMPGRGS